MTLFRHTVVLTVAFLTTMCAAAVSGGQLGPDLSERVLTSSAVEKIPVWIRLPRAIPVASLKASAAQPQQTAADRYRLTANQLRAQHTQAQTDLLRRLEELRVDGVVSNIKPHWIANVVSCDVAAGELTKLASRSDIETIYAVPKPTTIEPDRSSQVEMRLSGTEDNLTYINADDAWAAGYTGEGSVICIFDTGVDGDHPALLDGWKGHDGDSAAAWFDPRFQNSFPSSYLGSSHGTHVTGITVGHDDLTGDTVGVAPGAKWIAAAVIDIDGASIIDAFEWAADPDRDPNTTDDVPDVINHSWGVPDVDCDNLFYDMIDNTEALGIVNIFAAGNDGSASSTIRNPANRAEDSLDCFAVGNIDHSTTPPVIRSNSSRGPSDCNGAIKPNVCAPGFGIRSSIPGTGYTSMSGTSMSAPHVAGLVALLRQKRPDATVDEIKAAILTTARDYSYSLPNNDYGWGVIDCMAALDALDAAVDPSLRVWSFDHAPINAGDTVTGTVVLENRGLTATDISATLIDDSPFLTVLDGTANFGTVAQGDTVRSADQIRVVVDGSLEQGASLALDFVISDGFQAYQDTAKLYFVVDPPLGRLFATHTINQIEFTLSNFGTYGAGNNSFFPAGGSGFLYEGSTSNNLYECGLMLTTGPAQVSDGVRNLAAEPDGDFQISPGGNIVRSVPGVATDEELHARFNDSRAVDPIGVDILQDSYASNSPGEDNYIIVRYIVTNTNAFPINGLYLGLYMDWDVISYSSNAGGWDATYETTYMAYFNGSSYQAFRGVRVVDGDIATSYTGPGSEVYFPSGFTETEKFGTLVDGFGSADTYKTARTDLYQVISAGPMLIPSGESDTVAFAIMAGDNQSELQAAAVLSQSTYDTRVNTCCVGIAGNVNDDDDETVNIVDLTYFASYLFTGGDEPPCLEEADVNRDGQANIVDITYLVNYLFKSGDEPLSCYP